MGLRTLNLDSTFSSKILIFVCVLLQLTNDIHLSIQGFTKENSVEHISADN